MKKYLVCSIDVEPDCSRDWTYSDPLRFSGVSIGIAKRLHPLFSRYSIKPTYMLNNVVLEDPGSVAILLGLGGDYELGAHLHPEFIAPEKEYEQYAGRKGAANLCFYPPDLEFEKIQSMTRLFQQSLGYFPRSFRAGRYSAGPNTIKSLIRLGYLVDSSITPHLVWNDSTRERPVDFSRAPEQPYLVNPDDLCLPDSGGNLLEVPISISWRRRNWVREGLTSVAGWRRPFQPFRACWLRPHYSNSSQMIRLVRHFLEVYQSSSVVVFNMMFHNVEVMPGLSPYAADEADCKTCMDHLQEFFSYCRRTDIQSVGLSDLYHVYRSN
jgi:hypothetical protein